MSLCLIVFAKSPRLGTVKTRLEAAYSKKVVRDFYLAFLRDTLEMTQRVRGVDRRLIAFTPPDGEALLRRALGARMKGCELVPQQGGDLGARMGNAFQQSFQQGASLTVIIGTDSPSLPARSVEEAFEALAKADVVLGPTSDGGYYLVGIRKSVGKRDFLRTGIDWSTERALQQTLANARRAGLKTHLLAPWYDVDNADGLHFLQAYLASMAACGEKPLARNSWRLFQKQRLPKPPTRRRR